jgi:hypothetical protein
MRRVLVGWVCWSVLLAGCSSDPFLSNQKEDSPAACLDGQDNDTDGLTDCKDPDCAGLSVCADLDSGSSWPDQGPYPDAGHKPDAGSCASTETVAEKKLLPVDIIWMVDTSGSMDFETKTVQNNLNAFVTSITSSKVDYHVVMVAGTDVCVPPPLGGTGCTDGTRYKHIKLGVGSDDALEKVVQAYPQFQSFLRTDSLKHFVVVSDDNSDKNAAWFTSQLATLTNPGFPNGFIFHSIVAYGPIPFIGCITGAAYGSVYLTLTSSTGGVKAEVCATNWSPIFTALAKGVVANTTLPCTYVIPAPGGGKTIDPKKVNVSYTSSSGTKVIPKVTGASDCASKSGWYYDDDTKPTTITLCPNLCKTLTSGKIKILFGCKTIIE